MFLCFFMSINFIFLIIHKVKDQFCQSTVINSKKVSVKSYSPLFDGVDNLFDVFSQRSCFKINVGQKKEHLVFIREIRQIFPVKKFSLLRCRDNYTHKTACTCVTGRAIFSCSVSNCNGGSGSRRDSTIVDTRRLVMCRDLPHPPHIV